MKNIPSVAVELRVIFSHMTFHFIMREWSLLIDFNKRLHPNSSANKLPVAVVRMTMTAIVAIHLGALTSVTDFATSIKTIKWKTATMSKASIVTGNVSVTYGLKIFTAEIAMTNS